jgi:hypothetical protein
MKSNTNVIVTLSDARGIPITNLLYKHCEFGLRMGIPEVENYVYSATSGGRRRRQCMESGYEIEQ